MPTITKEEADDLEAYIQDDWPGQLQYARMTRLVAKLREMASAPTSNVTAGWVVKKKVGDGIFMSAADYDEAAAIREATIHGQGYFRVSVPEKWTVPISDDGNYVFIDGPGDVELDHQGKMREALEWYAEQARLARLIHSEGDPGRWALAEDGGKRAREVLDRHNQTGISE